MFCRSMQHQGVQLLTVSSVCKCGNSRRRSSATLLIRKLPKSIPASPFCVLLML